MTKLEFLQKYPELYEDGNVSLVKISLLKSYITYSISNGDDKIKNLLKDYHDMSKCENRDAKINYLLERRAIKRLKSNKLVI